MTTVTKLLSRDLFGLEKYMSWGVDVQSKQITASNKRAELIDEIDQYFEKLAYAVPNRERMRCVLEEMLMNAIYDAATDKTQGPLQSHVANGGHCP